MSTNLLHSIWEEMILFQRFLPRCLSLVVVDFFDFTRCPDPVGRYFPFEGDGALEDQMDKGDVEKFQDELPRDNIQRFELLWVKKNKRTDNNGQIELRRWAIASVPTREGNLFFYCNVTE